MSKYWYPKSRFLQHRTRGSYVQSREQGKLFCGSSTARNQRFVKSRYEMARQTRRPQSPRKHDGRRREGQEAVVAQQRNLFQGLFRRM